MQITAQDVNAEMIGYVRKREETDRQFLETQRELQEAQQAMLDTQSGLTQGQREMLERLERIEQQVKRGPTWQQVATIAVVALAIVVIAFPSHSGGWCLKPASEPLPPSVSGITEVVSESVVYSS